MAMPRIVRNTVFRLAKDDILEFLADNEDTLVHYVREELDNVDERLPEEQLFIDIKMGALGETLMRAVLAALVRFIEDY
ncbi:MAG: hypothetical protein NUW24_03930 [Anaerolineae bacterium]|nr:hypothetical protein [Anaerolineae bacterium]MDH7473081.1 hypothetical protein [Anaerolineae bacterium]